jgi:hypothetical protein
VLIRKSGKCSRRGFCALAALAAAFVAAPNLVAAGLELAFAPAAVVARRRDPTIEVALAVLVDLDGLHQMGLLNRDYEQQTCGSEPICG